MRDPQVKDPSARLTNGLASQASPASRAARPHCPPARGHSTSPRFSRRAAIPPDEMANDIDGASMLWERHRWGIDVVAGHESEAGGWRARTAMRMRRLRLGPPVRCDRSSHSGLRSQPPVADESRC